MAYSLLLLDYDIFIYISSKNPEVVTEPSFLATHCSARCCSNSRRSHPVLSSLNRFIEAMTRTRGHPTGLLRLRATITSLLNAHSMSNNFVVSLGPRIEK